ncbi:dihydropteroate synthase [Marinobacterium sedimentorum]|uniref:dihydropteroate synthase n=1 Tax=Marinobacterium sedimentorum TaxID=2927804 RepID=UPI0020C6496F|nr:dihydropteroate synthase [Marinobacterium sedimentorum]MCP8689664.1 dihydropteroate synthase [Marinobacterium sedimentorum]
MAVSNIKLKCGRRELDLSRVQVMGILNVTPDSFSDGNSLYKAGQPAGDKVLGRAARMVAEGATIIDLGGESTRPGAAPVSVQQELDRVLPALELIQRELDVIVSIDSSTAEVFIEAEKLGAGMLNDVRALGRDGALVAAAATGLPVCLMHMQGNTPADMQLAPHYEDIIAEVGDFLRQRVLACERAGISRDRLLLDPGFGFGKTLEHNLRLLNQMQRLQQLELPLLVGTSRKSMIGQALERPVDQRLAGSLATAVMAVQKGAKIIRVHDVAATVDAVRMTEAVMMESKGEQA